MKESRRLGIKLKGKANNVRIINKITEQLSRKDIEYGDSIKISIDRTTDTTYLNIDYYEKVYEPTCKFGYEDCICDPAYLKYNYGRDDIEYGCPHCEDGDSYDDEDK